MGSRIILASHMKTGSTVLTNVLYGLLDPHSPVKFSLSIPQKTQLHSVFKNHLITKTHIINMDGWMKAAMSCDKQYDLYFVCPERDDKFYQSKNIDTKYHSYDNVLRIQYPELLETKSLSTKDIIENMQQKLLEFLPDIYHPLIIKNKEKALKRISTMNEVCERMKDLPFGKVDPFHAIHGSHRKTRIEDIKKREQVSRYIGGLDSPVICEIGVRNAGHFSVMLTDNTVEAYGVDIWRETGIKSQNDSEYDQKTLDNQYSGVCNKYKNDPRVVIIRDFSLNAVKAFDDEYFDFVYIDAEHTYDGVLNDLGAWYPKVKKGGIISGHDYCECEIQGTGVVFGVIEAVQSFMSSHKIDNLHITDEDWPSFYIVK